MSLPVSKYLSDLKKHKKRLLYLLNIKQKLPEYSLKDRGLILKSLEAEIIKQIDTDCVKNFYSNFLN